MSAVYLASVGERRGAEAYVVLKIVRVDDEHRDFYRQTLENEVERLRRLKHPGIVRLYPVERPGLRNLPYMAQADLPGRPWFSVMEYLSGGSLAEWLKREKRLDIGVALEIGRSLAMTLDYLHNVGQVHLDLKPENVLFRWPVEEGVLEPVLIDFGISRHIGQGGLEGGTLLWTAPERLRVIRGEEAPERVRPHPAMDIYGLGMIVYQMVTGRLPYEGRTREGLTTAILRGEATAPSRYQPLVKEELERLILRMIAREPEERPRAEEVAMWLEEMAIRLGYQSRYWSGGMGKGKVEEPKGGKRGVWRSLAMAGLAMVVVVETALLAYWQPWQNPLSHVQSPSAMMPETPGVPNFVTQNISTPGFSIFPASSLGPTSTPSPLPPTSTPVMLSFTHTASPTNSPTLRPTNTPTPRPTPTPTPPGYSQAPILVEPADGAEASPEQAFRWQWFEPSLRGLDERFDWRLFRSRIGEDVVDVRQTQEFSLVYPVGNLPEGDYYWSVRVIRVDNNGRVLAVLSPESNRFHIRRPPSPSPTPTWTPPPPPELF